MANIPLQSISFPGLSDKYTTPMVDATLTQTGAAADAKKTGDEIGAIKNDLSEFPNGNYPQMGAGYANQLVSGLKKADSTPYNFRRIPYDATLEDVEKIVGGTVVWNQLVKSFTNAKTVNGVTFTASGGAITVSGTATSNAPYPLHTVPLFANHVYFLKGCPSGGGNDKYAFYANETNPQLFDTGAGSLQKQSADTTGSLYFIVYNGQTVDFTFIPQLFDVTQDFGTAIADYVYSLETATAGAGVAWLKEHFPKQFDAGYQAYDAGTLKSIEGLTEHKTVGFNQWNEVWENGTINGQGQDAIGTAVRPKGYIPVFPNTAYYIPPVMDGIFWYDADKNFISLNYSGGVKTSPNNAHFVRFYTQASYGQTYNHDICINLSDPTKNGTYKPYEAHSYALDSDVVLRGIPKLNSNNQLYYDGDEYLPDGTVNRRYGIVDLGTLTWSHTQAGYFFTTSINTTLKKGSAAGGYNHIKCALFVAQNVASLDVLPDKSMSADSGGNIQIHDSAYPNNNAFETAMSGVYLIYELATPTTETADPYQTPQIISPDGTEEYIYEDGAFELPVGHTSDYPVDVSGQLDDILDTPSANGTYTLKATVTDGAVSYSWVADA